MEPQASTRQQKQGQKLEEAYRRGYHHGLARTRELLLRLLDEGIPASVAMDLCRIFEEQIVVPWRTQKAEQESAPPVFDVEDCQRRLREEKQQQSKKPS